MAKDRVSSSRYQPPSERSQQPPRSPGDCQYCGEDKNGIAYADQVLNQLVVGRDLKNQPGLLRISLRRAKCFLRILSSQLNSSFLHSPLARRRLLLGLNHWLESLEVKLILPNLDQLLAFPSERIGNLCMKISCVQSFVASPEFDNSDWEVIAGRRGRTPDSTSLFGASSPWFPLCAF